MLVYALHFVFFYTYSDNEMNIMVQDGIQISTFRWLDLLIHGCNKQTQTHFDETSTIYTYSIVVLTHDHMHTHKHNCF